MKERIYKLKESKAVKTLLSLSLAFVLLLACSSPVNASAMSVSDMIATTRNYVDDILVSSQEKSAHVNTVIMFIPNTSKETYVYGFAFNVPVDCYVKLWEKWSKGTWYYYGFDICRISDDSVYKTYTDMRNVSGSGLCNPKLYVGGEPSYSIGMGNQDVGGNFRVYDYVVASDSLIYDINGNKISPIDTFGNANQAQWNEFEASTKDVIGYKYASANGVDWSGWIWKEVRFNNDVYPYWDTDENGVHRLMVYVPFSGTEYMTKDLGFYYKNGVYDYYKHTIEYTDVYILQPFIWYEDYYPNVDESDKNYCVMELPYAVEYKDGYVISEKTQIEVYANKEEAVMAYQNDYDVVPTLTPSPTIPPQPSPIPLPPTDDSESMGFVDFIKQFENLFNASGNLWKIMFYCFAYIPQQILWCMWSAVQIFLAVMIIKWIRE